MTTRTIIVAVVVALLVNFTAHANNRVGSTPHYCSPLNPLLVAQDAITLTIREVHNTRIFINSIPRLKSMKDVGNEPQIIACIGGLVESMSDIHSILERLRHLKKNPHIPFSDDFNSLKTITGNMVRFDNTCDTALKDADKFVMLMLKQKVVETALMIGDVVLRVSQLDLARAPPYINP